MLERILFVEIS